MKNIPPHYYTRSRGVLLLTWGVLLVLLQDSDPLVQAVVGDGGSPVPSGAVVVLHPPALPLQRGEARRSSPRGGIQPGDGENGRAGRDQKDAQQSPHFLDPVN